MSDFDAFNFNINGTSWEHVETLLNCVNFTILKQDKKCF